MKSWLEFPVDEQRMERIKAAFDSVASDKTGHSYERVYQRFLPRNASAILEIGISNYGGEVDRGCGSLFAWRALYPEATIYGGDHKEDRMTSSHGIRTHLADQNSQQSLDEFVQWLGGKKFDVIIDDASHTFSESKRTLEALRGRLAPGGMYFVEDVARNREANNWQQTVADWEWYLQCTIHEIVDARPEVADDVDSVMICMRWT